MTPIQFIVIVCSLLLMIMTFFLLTISRVEGKKKYWLILAFGVFGWCIAYLIRLVPLRILPLVFEWVNNTNGSEIINMVQFNLATIMIGPILAGIFEEIKRYILSTTVKPLRKDHSRGPLILGLGWALAEVLFLYLFLFIFNVNSFFTTGLPWSYVLAGGFERISASIFHISMSFLVFYAVFEEKWKKKTGLWLAIGLHFGFELLIILSVGTIGYDQIVLLWILEGIVFLIVVCIALWVFKVWIPTKELTLTTKNAIIDKASLIKDQIAPPAQESYGGK